MGVGWKAFRLPDVATDDAVMAYGDAAENTGVAIDSDIVLQNRMARNVEGVAIDIELETLAAKGDTLIKAYVVADDAGLAYNHTCTVVDAEVLADLGSRMDVDTCTAVGQLGNDAGNDGHTQGQQQVGDAVVQQGDDGGIGEDDFLIGAGGGVTVINCLDIGVGQALDLWQRLDKLHGDFFRLLAHVWHLILGKRLQAETYLFAKQSIEFLHPHADEILAHIRAIITVAEIAGEDDGFHQFDDAFQAVEPRQLTVLLRYVGILAAIGVREQCYVFPQNVCDVLAIHNAECLISVQNYSILTEKLLILQEKK